MAYLRSRVIYFPHSSSQIHPPATSRGVDPPSPRRISNSLLSNQRNLPSISSPRGPLKHNPYLRDLPIASPRLQSKEPSYRPSYHNKQNHQNSKNMQHEILSHILFCTAKVIPESAREMEEKNMHLTCILQFINKFSNQMTVISTILPDLFTMLTANLFRTIHPLSPFLLYSDSKVLVTQPMFPNLQLVHSITIALIKKLQPSELHAFINHQFITSFVELFATPDVQERASLEMVTAVIFDRFPKQRGFMFQRVLQVLNGFLQGTRTYPCVPPCLRYIHNYLRLVPQSRKDISQITKSVIAPLFAKHFSAEFFEDLQNLTAFVCEGDPQLTTWMLQYLIMHFPMTDSTKQCYFLQHFLTLIKILPYNGASHIASQIFSLIADSLKSDNFRVSLCAMEILQNQNFMHQFAPYSGAVTRMIVPCLQQTKNHWCDMVREATNDTMKAMKDFDKSADRIVAKGDNKMSKLNRESYNMWAAILHSSENSLDASEKQKISANLSKFATTIGVM